MADTWEERMSARAKERERMAMVKRAAAGNPRTDPPQPGWLNGWYRNTASSDILIGTEVHCVCCGRSRGITTVAYPSDWDGGPPTPEWPFHPDDCPLCFALGRVSS